MLQTLRARLRRLTTGRVLLREISGIRQELQALTAAATAIAAELQRDNDHTYGALVQARPDVPPVEITYADDQYGQRISEIVGRLTQATGRIPSDDEAFEEYLRRYPDSAEARDVAQAEDQLGPWGTS